MLGRQRSSTGKNRELLRGSGVAGAYTFAEVGANGSLQAPAGERWQTVPNAYATERQVEVRNGR